MTVSEKFLKIINNPGKYPTYAELLYKHKFNTQDIRVIANLKLNDKHYKKLQLKNEDGTPVLYFLNQVILDKFGGSEDLVRNENIKELEDVYKQGLATSFFFSEIESSLAIEGVKSTRAQIVKVNTLRYEELESTNEIIVKNMILAYQFVKERKIDKENIIKLYNILTKGCLSEDERLLKNNYYRHDEVDILGADGVVFDKGVAWTKLENMTDDLIKYIHLPRSYEQHLIAAHTIHYYILYMRPYFDFNGRIARVLSYWYSICFAPSFTLSIVSGAINDMNNKRSYYAAITNSGKMNNDITYFIEYMANITLDYTKIYLNHYVILKKLKGDGIKVNRSVEVGLKNVLAIPKIGEGYFDWKDYKDYTDSDFSKVTYLKILNQLVDLNVLKVKMHKKVKLFVLNHKKWELI